MACAGWIEVHKSKAMLTAGFTGQDTVIVNALQGQDVWLLFAECFAEQALVLGSGLPPQVHSHQSSNSIRLYRVNDALKLADMLFNNNFLLEKVNRRNVHIPRQPFLKGFGGLKMRCSKPIVAYHAGQVRIQTQQTPADLCRQLQQAYTNSSVRRQGQMRCTVVWTLLVVCTLTTFLMLVCPQREGSMQGLHTLVAPLFAMFKDRDVHFRRW